MAEDLDDSTQDSGKGLNGDAKKDSKKKTCMQCGTIRKKLKVKGVYKGEQVQFCNQDCFTAYREKDTRKKEKCEACHEELESGGFLCSRLGTQQPLCSAKCFELTERKHAHKRLCNMCSRLLQTADADTLLWEAMEFCGVPCLRRYQLQIGATCAKCRIIVQETSLGKYCVRFGADIRQFCSGKCLEDFKKVLKVCAYCQKDLTRERIEPLVAQVGEKGIFKDFCSRDCVKSYENLTPNRPIDPSEKCKICTNKCSAGTKQLQFKHGAENKEWGSVCSEQCLARFRYDRKVDGGYCENCQCFTTKQGESVTLQLGLRGLRKKFCSKTCLNLFVLSHRKIVPCSWCKVKKYNFDMIEKCADADQVQLFCSINCLNLHKSKSTGVPLPPRQPAQIATLVQTPQTSQRQVVVQPNYTQNAATQLAHQTTTQASQPAAAAKPAGVRCDQCTKMDRPQFHLTMSDASVRNFCCYTCAVAFQDMFKNRPTAAATATTQQQQHLTNMRQNALQMLQQQQQQTLLKNKVMLTATTVAIPPANQQNVQQKRASFPTAQIPIVTTKTPTAPLVTRGIQIQPQAAVPSATQTIQLPAGVSLLNNVPVVIRPPPPKEVKNRLTQCKPSDEEDERDRDFIEEAVTGKKKPPSVRRYLDNLDKLEATHDRESLKQFLGELLELSSKLTERLKEPKINGGFNHDGNGGIKRGLEDETDENDNGDEKSLQQNGDHPTKKVKKEEKGDVEQTLIATALDQWRLWLKERDQVEEECQLLARGDLTKLSSGELNQALCAFGKHAQGSSSPTEILRLMKVFIGIQLHLLIVKPTVNIFNGDAFYAFNDYICTLTASLDNAQSENEDLIDEELLWRTGLLGCDNPEVLLNTVAFVLAKTAHIVDPDEHDDLKMEHVCVETSDVDGKATKILKVKNEVVCERNVALGSRCSVSIVEKYISKRPPSKSQPNSSFYLEPRQGQIEDEANDPWYTEEILEAGGLSRALNRYKCIRFHT